jgi:hypothetical protein
VYLRPEKFYADKEISQRHRHRPPGAHRDHGRWRDHRL